MMHATIVSQNLVEAQHLEVVIHQFFHAVKNQGILSGKQDFTEELVNHDSDFIFYDLERALHPPERAFLEKTKARIILLATAQQLTEFIGNIPFYFIILKPINLKSIMPFINHINTTFQHNTLDSNFSNILKSMDIWAQSNQQITVRDKTAIHVLNIRDILYCAADGGYTQFHLTQDQRIISSKGLKHYHQSLEEFGFFRVHHSFLVNQRFIIRFNKLDSMLILQNGQQIPVSSRRKENLEQLLKSRALV